MYETFLQFRRKTTYPFLVSLRFAVPSFNVTAELCVAPTLNYRATTEIGQQIAYIYTVSPFTSSCSGVAVGYWFCYQNTNGNAESVTALLLKDMGSYYCIIEEFPVEAGEDSCLPGSPDGQCCVTRRLSAESQFEVNSSYLYGVTSSPNIIQTNFEFASDGYTYTSHEYEILQMDDMLEKHNSREPTSQPVKMFQFIIGKFRFSLFCSFMILLIYDKLFPRE